LKSKFSSSTRGEKVKHPKALTEQGLYMMATIIKNPQAVQIIIDSFCPVPGVIKEYSEHLLISVTQPKS